MVHGDVDDSCLPFTCWFHVFLSRAEFMPYFHVLISCLPFKNWFHVFLWSTNFKSCFQAVIIHPCPLLFVLWLLISWSFDSWLQFHFSGFPCLFVRHFIAMNCHTCLHAYNQHGTSGCIDLHCNMWPVTHLHIYECHDCGHWICYSHQLLERCIIYSFYFKAAIILSRDVCLFVFI